MNGGAASPKGHSSPTADVLNNGDAVMQRNRELADRVKQLQQKNNQLNRQMQLQTERVAELEKHFNTSESEATQKANEELQKARERLEVHIQTIGILVEEKQTLQSQLSSSQKHSQQKSDEIEDYTSRLKASRLRVADLEKQLAVANTHRTRAETASGDNSKQVDKLKQDLYTKSRDLDEVLEQRAQLENQLQSKLSANAELEASLSDLRGKLDLSQAYIQQLNSGEVVPSHPNLYAEQVEELRAQNNQLHETISQLEDSLQKAQAERNQSIDQYNQIIQSLQLEHQQVGGLAMESSHGQITSLQQQIQDFQLENKNLQTQLEEAQNQRSGAESSEMESLEDTPPPADAQTAGNVYSEEQMQSVVYQYEQLRLQYTALVGSVETMTSDNQQLSRLLEDREEAISRLESTLESIQDEKDNSKRLLETVEGDKSALSRALSQNKQLKTQLEELEGRFIKMAEDNMTSVTSLQSEQHRNKELSNQLAEKESLLHQTGQSLAEKQNFIAEHEAQFENVSKMSHQQELLADRIRHYEAQIQIMGTLQRELHSSQETVRALTAQNSELRGMIVQRGTSVQSTSNEPTDNTDTENTFSANATDSTDSVTPTTSTSADQSSVIQQLSTAIQQLEAEKAHLENRCEQVTAENNRLSNQLLSQSELPVESNRITRQQSKAELLDRSEILEYENMQLEAESETINEYIALYHQQRSLMKSRAEDKDRYIQQLADEREKVSVKLSELQSLVVRLLQDRQYLHSYTNGSSVPIGSPQHNTSQPNPSQSMDDWPDYESESDTSQVEAIINQSSPATPSDESLTMDTSIESANEHQPSSTRFVDMSQDFIEGGERSIEALTSRISYIALTAVVLLSQCRHVGELFKGKII
ncbi:GM130 [Bugula neritina]|uniref:GM130 n=1 Tax=Bugula neritina TaxID=10212 RepID=A0A7J7K3J4_BUGNE|nr:GM130 [Bugula neritina]